VVSQAAAGAILLAGGGDRAPDAVGAIALVVADLILLAVVVLFARRGAERLTPTTLGVRRTRFWPAVGWMLAIYFGVVATQGVWLVILAIAGAGGGGDSGHDTTAHLAAPSALLVLLGAAVTAPIVEEVSFRGYLFPALTRWRGPWTAAALTAVLFGAAHGLVYPPVLLPLMVAFGFGACLLFLVHRIVAARRGAPCAQQRARGLDRDRLGLAGAVCDRGLRRRGDRRARAVRARARTA
jgi:uncharacterized protein